MGYLGGPNFPEDPTDLGPLVPLPGGFQEVFEFLAGLGFRGFEFFQFTQNVNELGRQPTHAEIRSYLDAAGLTSTGTHTGGLGVMYDPVTGGLSANGQLQIQIAQTLGHTMIGTAGDPSGRATLGNNPANPNQIGWTEAAHRANVVGGILAGVGMRWYWHTEQNGWQFFNDPDHPELSRTHRIDWWTANTDPSLVFFEPDIFHSYSGRARFPDPVDGSKWDAFGFWKANTHRLVGWHVKDGTRLASSPHRPRTRSRRRSCGHRRSLRVGSRTTTLSTPARERSGRAIRSTRIRLSSASRGSSTTSGTRAQSSRFSRRTAGSGRRPTRAAHSGTRSSDRVPARAPRRAEHTRVARRRG